MQLIALLAPEQLSRLRESAPAHVAVRALSATREAVVQLCSQRIDALWLDPTWAGSTITRLLCEVALTDLRKRDIPIVLYCEVTAAALRALADIAASGYSRISVVICGFDDSIPALQRWITQALLPPIAATLIQFLTPRLLHLPNSGKRAVVDLFAGVERFRSVADIAFGAGIPRRTFDRWLASATMPSATRLWHVARVARSFTRLQGATVYTVARMFGHSSEKLFAREVAIVTGVSPGHLRRLTEDEVVATLAAYLASASARSHEGKKVTALIGDKLSPLAEHVRLSLEP